MEVSLGLLHSAVTEMVPTVAAHLRDVPLTEHRRWRFLGNAGGDTEMIKGQSPRMCDELYMI